MRNNCESTQLAVRTLRSPAAARTVCRACDVPEAPLDANCCRARPSGRVAPAAARGRRARRGPPLHESVDAEHVDRHELLSARLVHDEVQPEAARAAGRAAGLRRPASAPAGRDAPGHARSCCARCSRSSPRSPACRRRLAAAGRRRAGRADRPARRRRLLPRPAARTAPRCSSPTAPTAPTPPAPRIAGFDAVTVKSNANGPRRSRRPAAPSSTTRPPCS